MTIEELYRDTFSRSKNDQNTAMQSLITGIKYSASVSVVFTCYAFSFGLCDAAHYELQNTKSVTAIFAAPRRPVSLCSREDNLRS